MSRSKPEDLADELAIHALVARYCHAVAERDDDGWAATWAADAEWIVLGHAVRGRDAILAHYRTLVGGLRFVVQVATNGVVELAGDEADGRWLVCETLQAKDGRPGTSLGQYLDRYRREPDGIWRFARRAFRGSYLGPADLSAEARPLPPRTPAAR